MPSYNLKIDGVTFVVPRGWRYSIHTRHRGSSHAVVFEWHEMRTLSLFPTVQHVFLKACIAFPNRYVYVVDAQVRGVAKSREPLACFDAVEPIGVE